MTLSTFGRIAACAVFIAAPLAAQRPDSALARPDSGDAVPFVRGGVYDKPYQNRLSGRTAMGGYAEAQARYHRTDGVSEDNGFIAKRFNLFASTRVSDYVRFAAELEFEDGAQEILLEYAAIDLQLHSLLTVRGGMILSPLGKFNLSHDSPLNAFTDRPFVSTDLLGVALSEPGFGILGKAGVGRGGRLTYELYATNGFHDGLITNSEAGTRVAAGRHNFEDNNGSPAVVGRIAVSPRLGYELGLSAHHGAYNVFEEEGLVVDERRDVTLAVLDFELTVLRTRIAGEGALVRVDIPAGLRGIYADRQRGFYVEGVRDFWRGRVTTMPRSRFSAKARLDYVDFDTRLDGTSETRLTVGVNFHPTPEAILKFDFGRGRGRDEFNNPSENAMLLFSLATYF